MRSARLTLALESGSVALTERGSIAVIGPRAGDDLSALPLDRVRVVQGFRPDHDHFAALGFAVDSSAGAGHAAALVCVPRARDAARAAIAAAVAAVVPGAPVLVDGQKTDGIDSLLRDIRAHVATTPPLSKAHGRIFAFAASDAFADWRARDRVVEGGFVTRPGVFSADGPDRGSALLGAALPPRLPGFGVDLGAGWGYLSRAALSRDGVARIDLVEAEAAAFDCARANVTDPRARFHWADATDFWPERAPDWVICNPPFHGGRAADPGLGLGFIRAAARMLHPAGTLWLVANRHLPYGALLTESFREVEEIGQDPVFRLTRAARPRRARA